MQPKMANPDHLRTLRQGVDAWNAWRKKRELFITPDLSEADLSGADLRGANLSRANLNGANLFRADLSGANLSEADLAEADLSVANLSGADLSRVRLRRAHLSETDLSGANLSKADLSETDLNGANLIEAILIEANLSRSDLSGANLSGANLSGANLSGAVLAYASLVDADITNADLTGCRIYGVSAWGLKLSNETRQRNLIITRTSDELEITVDNIEVAQFIYLLLHNQKIRDVIDTITSKVVLILGRFTDERKAVLGALRDELRKRDYLPILFDFDKPASRNTDETVTLLARMARFVIADISDAKSVLQELRAIVPELPSVPVQPVIIASQDEPGMFDFYRGYRSFLPVHRYDTPAQLLAVLGDRVIKPSEAKALELRATTVATSLNLQSNSRDSKRLAYTQEPTT
jgi:uncharacterized protein YjbI with pentapeptide repeats